MPERFLYYYSFLLPPTLVLVIRHFDNCTIIGASEVLHYIAIRSFGWFGMR